MDIKFYKAQNIDEQIAIDALYTTQIAINENDKYIKELKAKILKAIQMPTHILETTKHIAVQEHIKTVLPDLIVINQAIRDAETMQSFLQNIFNSNSSMLMQIPSFREAFIRNDYFIVSNGMSIELVSTIHDSSRSWFVRNVRVVR